MMSIGLWSQEAVFTHVIDVGTGYVQVMYRLFIPGRAPRTKETLPAFREKCWVTRHSRVFPRVDG